jgi:hypothetical protein
VRDDAGEFHGAGVERPNTLCRACEESAFADIRQLDDDWLLLNRARTLPRSTTSGPKVSGSSERPVPINLAVDTLFTAITEETTRWERRLPGPLCSCLGTLIDLPPSLHIVWLPHADGGDNIMEVTLDGVDAVLRLSALHHRAVKLLGLDEPKDEWLREQCHVCGMSALTSSLRTSLITCRGCRNVWDQDEFARLNNPMAAA